MKTMMKMVMMTLVLWVSNVAMVSPASNHIYVKPGKDVVVNLERYLPVLTDLYTIDGYRDGKLIEVSGRVYFYRNMFVILKATPADSGMYTFIFRLADGARYETRIYVYVE